MHSVIQVVTTTDKKADAERIARELVEGRLAVPQGPGLGIEIDRDALAHFRIA